MSFTFPVLVVYVPFYKFSYWRVARGKHKPTSQNDILKRDVIYNFIALFNHSKGRNITGGAYLPRGGEA